MTTYRFRPSIQEETHLETLAARYGQTVEDYIGMVLAHHALGRTLPPPAAPARPRETQAEKRARLRDLDPDGKSPYTRTLEAITTRKDLNP